MRVFEIVIAVLLGGAGLTAIARRLGMPYPALVALAGAALALVPGTPTIVLDPDLALALFAKVIEAIGPVVPVGSVGYGPESIDAHGLFSA